MSEDEYRVIFSLAEPGDATPAIACAVLLAIPTVAGLITWGLLVLFT